MADEVVLLDYWLSPYAMRLRIALALKGIEYERKEEELNNKSPLLLQSNPVHKKVPVLIHNGKPICESVVALQYIDEVWNDKAPLFPSDPYLRSQAKFWADYVDKTISGFARKLWSGAKGEEMEAVKKDLFDCLRLFEGELGDKPFFGGETLGLVDLALLPFASWFSVHDKFGTFSLEAECPKIPPWVKRCFQMESVSESVPSPDQLYDYVVKMRNSRQE
ncbi:putative glutathione S-transferase [Rosa sericea]